MLEARLGKYELLEKLGRGATADVYRATDTVLGRQVALKVIEVGLSDPAAYTEEARTLDRLHHPNIVAVHGAEIIGGKVLIDMELMAGRTLKDRLADAGPVPVEEALTVTAHLLNGLAYAHANHVLHRDVKPDNVFLGDGGAVKLGDFGNARPFATGVYHAGGGTYPYMAPEAFAGTDRFDRRSDLWSVGVVLYRMLTGRLPFLATPPADPFAWKALLDRREKLAPLGELRADIPNGLPGVVGKALAYDKAARFPAADVFLNALKQNGLYPLPNTEAERLRADRYVAAYNRVDDHLRADLGLGRATGFADVVRAYAQRRTGWTGEAYFLEAARVRNALTHGLRDAARYRPVPSPEAVAALESAAERLVGPALLPSPPPQVIVSARPPVTAPPSDDLAHAQQIVDEMRHSETARRLTFRTPYDVPRFSGGRRTLTRQSESWGPRSPLNKSEVVSAETDRDHSLWSAAVQQPDRDVASALATAAALPDGGHKVTLLSRIADMKERTGDVTGGQEMLADVLAATLRLPPEDNRIRNSHLEAFVSALAEAGDMSGALALARLITGEGDKVRALRRLAYAQFQAGDAAGGRATLTVELARATGHTGRGDQTVPYRLNVPVVFGYGAEKGSPLERVQDQIKAGDVPGAQATAQTIMYDREKLLALRAVAPALETFGDREGCRTVLAEMFFLALRLPVERDSHVTDNFIGAFAVAQAGAGDVAGASFLERLLPDSSPRALALCKIAQAQRQAGNRDESRTLMADALAVAQAMTNWYSKSSVFCVIAEAQAQAGDVRESAATIMDALTHAREDKLSPSHREAIETLGEFASQHNIAV